MKLFSVQQTGNKTIISILGIKIKYKNKNDTYLDDILKQWETDYDPARLERELGEIVKKPVAAHNREIYLVYISTLIENKKPEEAQKWLDDYVYKYGAEDLPSFPLICKMAKNAPFADAKIKKTAEILEYLEKYRQNGSLEKLLAGKSLAIVGNSPNLMGKKRGPKIDAHDFVVRFNNYKTEGFEEDYGAKTNIWICCQANDIVNPPAEKARQLDYILYNVDFWHTKLREKCFQNLCENIALGLPISYIGSQYKHELKQFGIVYPSSGLTGIYHLSHLTELKRKNIFGFSFLDNNQNYYEHYFKQRPKGKIKKFNRTSHHKFSDESSLLNELFKD